jgi:hypothetical protein
MVSATRTEWCPRPDMNGGRGHYSVPVADTFSSVADTFIFCLRPRLTESTTRSDVTTTSFSSPGTPAGGAFGGQRAIQIWSRTHSVLVADTFSCCPRQPSARQLAGQYLLPKIHHTVTLGICHIYTMRTSKFRKEGGRTNG